MPRKIYDLKNKRILKFQVCELPFQYCMVLLLQAQWKVRAQEKCPLTFNKHGKTVQCSKDGYFNILEYLGHDKAK